MVHRSFRSVRMTGLMALAVAMLAWSAAPSFAAGNGDEDVPSTSIVPAEGPSGAPSAGVPSSTSPAPEPHAEGATAVPARPRASVHHAASHPLEVEPAQARLKVLTASPVYTAPTKMSKKIEELT